MIRSNISSVINRNNYLNLIRFSTRINQQTSSKDSDPLPQTSSGFNQRKSDKSGNAWTAHAYSFKGKQRDVSNFPDPQQPLTSPSQSNTNASTSTSSTSSTTTSSTYDNDSKPKSRLRARAAAINLSPSAVEQLRILSSAKSQLLRVGVKNKGCSGMSYHLEYVDKPAKFDEIVEQDGVKVLVDSKALFSVIGSTMDWVDDRLSFEVVDLNEELVKYLELLSEQLQIPLYKLKFINNGLVIKNYSTRLSQLKSLQFVVLINHSGVGVGSSSSIGTGNVNSSDNVNSESNLISVINDIINNKVKVLDEDLVNYETLSANEQFNVNVNQDKKGNEKLNFERLRLQELYLQSMLKLDSIDLPSSFNEARNIRKSSIRLTQQNLNRLDEAITSQFNFPSEERKVLELWKDIDAFKTQLKINEGNQTFSFYDGPPFATGLPHYGHLLAGTVKDIVTRHAASQGFHVPRRFGWDCHGLPVEHEIDKKLGIRGREDVMDMGIDKYNEECRAIVMRYSSEWRTTVERMGRWIDFDHDYKTLNTSFMESVWWVFGQLFNKDLVYRGLRVMPYSTACTTPLSNFEAGQAYKEVSDPAVVVSFPLVDDNKTSLLAWTTTPWTLPSNLALCVNPDFTYIKIHDDERDQNFIIHEKLLNTLYKDPKKAKFSKLESFKGSQMKDWKYIPLFDYFKDEYQDKAFRVLNDHYVSSDAGTGIVHQAPAFGDDDHRISIENGIVSKDQMPPCPVDDSGRYTEVVTDFKGLHVKEADKDIQKDIKNRGRLIVQSTIHHSYPFCWRSGTPLIYKAIPVWFVRVSQATDSLINNNSKTRWVPANIGEGRFGNWLQNARDWNISRNRYWGTPIPLWVSEDYEEIVAISSIKQLEELSGVSNISDIHRDKIDNITIPSSKGKGVLRRIDEVFDCWFESGSMPYAQAHYPFENKESFEKSFPADFVSEGLDQTRGWFYTMLVLGTHILGTAPWKNLIVTGLVLAADGKKMSKSLKNYPDPNIILEKYGADSLRMFLVNSPIVRGDNLRFREEGVKEVISRVLLPWLNSFRFFLGQAALFKKESGIEFKYDPTVPKSSNVMDSWVLARCQSLIKIVKEEMSCYRLYTVIPRLLSLIDELTNWYIRFNRKRLKGENGKEDTLAALNTLFEALFTLCRTMSSFTPFLTENLYQGLRQFIPENSLKNVKDTRSVHFLPFPEVREEYFDSIIERRVSRMQNIIELGRFIRERSRVAVKTPLKTLTIFNHDEEYLYDCLSLESYIKEELNVREINLTTNESVIGIKYKVTADWPTLGRKLRKDMPRVKNNLPKVSSEEVKNYMEKGEIEIDGIKLGSEDLVVSHYVDLPENMQGFEPQSDSKVTILLDVRLHPELESEGLAREFINRVQRLRKKACLIQTQDVDAVVNYISTGKETDAVKNSVEQHKESIIKSTKSKPLSSMENNAQVIISEDQEIGEVKFNLTLVGVTGGN